MPWWGWMVVGVLLLGAEVAVSTEFYLAILGLAAVTVGLIGLAGVVAPAWVQWLLFAALSVIYIVGFRRRIWQRLVGRAAGMDQDLIGEFAVMRGSLDAGDRGRAELRGATWNVKNVGDTSLDDGTYARVVGVEGILLHVRSEA